MVSSTVSMNQMKRVKYAQVIFLKIRKGLKTDKLIKFNKLIIKSNVNGIIILDNESMIAIYGIDVKLFAVILTSISLVLTVVIIFTITCVCKRSPKSANVDQDGQNHQQPPNTYSRKI